MTTHLVIGAGEVGMSLAEVLKDSDRKVIIRDVHNEPLGEPVDWIHIAFPYWDGFTRAVRQYHMKHRAKRVVVHSTVPVGTCELLKVIHSPVRGRHPYLAEGLRTFTKWFGGDNAEEAAREWQAVVGSPVATTPNPGDTEAGKAWELLMYGLAIAQQKEMYKWCEEHGVDPDVAYRQFTETYNEGYRKLGQPEVARPVIKNMPGKIGGHCVVQNAPLIDHEMSDMLVRLNETWEEK